MPDRVVRSAAIEGVITRLVAASRTSTLCRQRHVGMSGVCQMLRIRERLD
jgi:hypothetical protein